MGKICQLWYNYNYAYITYNQHQGEMMQREDQALPLFHFYQPRNRRIKIKAWKEIQLLCNWDVNLNESSVHPFNYALGSSKVQPLLKDVKTNWKLWKFSLFHKLGYV